MIFVPERSKLCNSVHIASVSAMESVTSVYDRLMLLSTGGGIDTQSMYFSIPLRLRALLRSMYCEEQVDELKY